MGEQEFGVGLILANPTCKLCRGHLGMGCPGLTVIDLAPRKATLPREGCRMLKEVKNFYFIS